LPEARHLDRLERLIASEPSPHDPLRRLATLIDVDAAGAMALAERLRLSNAQRDRLVGLAPPWLLDPSADERGQRRALYELGQERYRDLALLLRADGRMSDERFAEAMALATTSELPTFPLAGRDVTALGIPPGPAVGRLLAQVRRWWENGDFVADRDACLAKLGDEVAHEPRAD
jgi:poly(A) polymerase